MSYRIILLPMDGGDADGPALHAAFDLAKEFNSHVDALCVSAVPEDSVPLLVNGMTASAVQEILEAAQADIDARRERTRQLFHRSMDCWRFRAAGEGAFGDGPSGAWRERSGLAEDLLPGEARWSDLVVFAYAPDDTVHGSAIEATLVGAGRPVLMVPPDRATPIGRFVAIAWNGSVEAARSVVAGLPFLLRADGVAVLMAAPSAPLETEGARLTDYLAWHGIEANIVAVDPGEEHTGPVLAAKAAELGADLIVMGAYGYSRLREYVFGGVTRHALQDAGIARLLTH
ncbi:MAG TPA: universal stress protein [Azospirillum sp.]